MKASKSVLILGGSGYIGKNLGASLAQNGWQIDAPTRQEIDLEQQSAIHKLKQRLSGSVHLVVLSAITRARIDDLHSCFANVLHIKTLIMACEHVSPKSVIFASAADVYGPNPNATEKSPLRPINPYGAYKVFAETLLDQHFRLRCPFTHVRYASVFGGQNDNSSLIARFSHSILNGDTITLSNRGLTRRDYIPVQWLTTVIALLLEHPYCGPLNVATGESICAFELIEKLQTALEIPAQVVLTDDRSSRDFDLVLNNTRLRQRFSNLSIPSMQSALAKSASTLRDAWRETRRMKQSTIQPRLVI